MNALNLASDRPDPFSTFEFYDHFLGHAEAFPESGRLWLLLVVSEGSLIGYLALKQRTLSVLGIPASRLDLLTAYVADRPHLVARRADAPQAGAAICTYLLGRRAEWGLLEFVQQDVDSALVRAPWAEVGRAFRVREWPNMAVGIIALHWNTVAGYFAALSKKARSNVSRQMRTLLAAGDVQLLTASAPEAAAALFELYRSIEPHSWKVHADADIGRNRQTTDYYGGLIGAGQPMRIVIQVLLLDGTPIAGLISGSFGCGLYALHIVYDERQARLGPGSAILLMLVRLAIEGGYDFVNLMWGSGHFKSRWLAQMHATSSLQVYHLGSPLYWHRLIGDAGRRLLGRRAVDAKLAFHPAPGAEHTGQAPPRLAAAGPQAYAALIETVRCREGELLSTSQLAAAMPFATAGAH